MKKTWTFFVLLFLSNVVSGQSIASGEYDSGLKLAFDSETNKLTGYFESYTGWDDETKSPKFSCIFYLEGSVDSAKFTVRSYYPENRPEDAIGGFMEIISDSSITLQLTEEHGGCWNVQHFTDEPVLFQLTKEAGWRQINYVIAEKTFFYSEKSDDKIRNAYLVKNNFVCIDQLEDEWAHCTFFGEQVTTGWMKTADLNK